jgi:ubiquinone/menaquinone biosynthesis C-methylase UbiE
VDRYVIRGGTAGYDRLLLLARDRWPDTAALLHRAGLAPGMRAVDLGCGGGEVSMEIAGLVAPGTVVGVDMDPVKLGLAREAAERRGIGNVEFRVGDVTGWHEPAGYDAVYSRFLLQHLSDPVGLLRRMWAAVRPDGVLVVEDADFDGFCCHPPNAGFEFFLQAYGSVLRRRGGDHAVGRKLYRYLTDVGVPGAHVSTVQPVWAAGDTKHLAWSTLEASRDAIVSEGIASETEVDAALADLNAFTEDPGTLLSGPRVFQLWARRS